MSIDPEIDDILAEFLEEGLVEAKFILSPDGRLDRAYRITPLGILHAELERGSVSALAKEVYARGRGPKCIECGTSMACERYMVTDEVWADAGMDTHRAPSFHGDFLWIACLEGRLRRELVGADFTDYPINEPLPSDSALLRPVRR